MIHRECGVGQFITSHRRQRHLPARGRQQIQLVERLRPLPILRCHFHYHAILVNRRIDRRHLRLPVGEIERGIDGTRGNAHARGGLAIDGERGLQPAHLLIGIHIRQFRLILQRALQQRRPSAQVFQIIRAQCELIRGVALTPADTDILHRVQEQIGACDRAELGPQSRNHLVRGHAALLQGL